MLLFLWILRTHIGVLDKAMVCVGNCASNLRARGKEGREIQPRIIRF